MKKLLVALFAVGALSGITACTPGAGGPSIPSTTISATATPAGATPTPAGATPTPAAGVTSTSFVISLNGGGETILAKNRKPQFVSPSTQSITFSVDGGASTSQNLSASATNCAASNGGVKCAIPLANVAAGAHTLSLTTWSGTNGTGNALGANSSIAFTVVANQANTISGVIGGIAASINLVPSAGSVSGSFTQGFTLVYPGQPQAFIAEPVDASGNVIVGPGSPVVTAESGGGGIGFTVASTAQNAFTVTPASSLSPIKSDLGQLRLSWLR